VVFVRLLFVIVLFATVLSTTVPFVMVDSSQEVVCDAVSTSVHPDSRLLFIVDCEFCELVLDELVTLPPSFVELVSELLVIVVLASVLSWMVPFTIVDSSQDAV